MSETLRSILCGEDAWCWDQKGGNTIIFHEDGTGELQCRIEFNVYIGAEIEWNSLESLEQMIDITASTTPTPQSQLLAEIPLEITLTKRRTRFFQTGPMLQGRINEACLTDDAFQPKRYNVRLEKGCFLTPNHARHKIQSSQSEWFELRLVFDQSPYPPRDQWKEAEGGPDSNQFWTWTHFASRPSPGLKRRIDDSSWWSQCTIM